MFDPFDTIGFITVTLPQTNSSHLKDAIQKGKQFSNHQFSGPSSAFGGVKHHLIKG